MSFWDYVIPGYSAAKDASDMQSEAADRSRAAIQAGEAEMRELYAPYRDTGKAATFTLADLAGQSYTGKQGSIEDARSKAMEGFYNDPGYEFQQAEGQKALERSAASKGMLSSGALGKGLLKYSQGVADQGYQNWLRNLSGLSTQGLKASDAQSAHAMAGARSQASILDQQGAYQASGPVGQANAIQNMIDTGMEVAGMYYGREREEDPQQTAAAAQRSSGMMPQAQNVGPYRPWVNPDTRGYSPGSGYEYNLDADKVWYGGA